MEWSLLTKEEFFKAQIIKGRLESEGIPVKIEAESIGRMYGITLNGLGGAKIFVPSDLKEKAEKLLEDSK
ncbi:MAG TPA: hypothetical protein ENI31_06765 [Candidatus Omnitrophica bacterium]|nr:MAG: hypothetical protein DRP61_02365 [Candidatus Omnitrophota bacterium]RKY35713.1 MAG: hypothetical protein DRP69_00430 [Candidatus Omnitrophota bacterium]RKY42182.1 MAG: hypothetical protein DRP80_07055 [Candidatus Omnitrophota bacterium]HEC69964.1 hypothetical protein [Candidatus Omnitrophota bacterium]